MVSTMTEPQHSANDLIDLVETVRANMGSMPNQPKTPQRKFRVDDELWDAAKKKAASEHTTVSEVLRQALKEYVTEED